MGSNWAWPPGWRRLRAATFARYGHVCYRCGGYATTVDHAVPVARGGTHDLSNLRPACASCNSSTGASMGNRLRPWRPLSPAQRHAIAAKTARQVSPETWRQSRRW
jgi:5-methylcytosine-specific restriction endonuclease McrA